MDEKNISDTFRQLLRRTGKVLFIYDLDSASFTFLNEAFSYIWNRTRESVLHRPALILDTIHPEDRSYLLKEYKELLQGVRKNELEFRIILPDTSVRWLLLLPDLSTDARGKTFITGFAEDITLQKDNISNLQRFAAKKNSMLEILSHDLAGPLANIGSLAGLLLESTQGYKNEEVNYIIKLIQESSARSVRLIREFVRQEFIESANAGFVKRRVDLVEKMEEVMEQYMQGEQLIQKEFRFTCSTDTFYVSIDQNLFMQVINNLVSNAIKFTHDNGIISIDLSEKEAFMLITVQDNGIGIPRQYHSTLFEKFTPARREGLRGEPSTGLGMSIIKTIVEWHGGSIWFESEENKGSTFYIELPKD